jgi:hypothetical protein
MMASGLAGLLQELDSTRTPKPGCELIGLARLGLGDRQAKRPGLDEVGGRLAGRSPISWNQAPRQTGLSSCEAPPCDRATLPNRGKLSG